MNVDLISTKQAAREFGLSIAWFERQRWKGTGPEYIKIGSRVLYNRGYLKQWFLQHIVTTATDQQGG